MARTIEEDDLEAASSMLTAGGWTPPSEPNEALLAVLKRHEKLANMSPLHLALLLGIAFTIGAGLGLSP